MEAAPAAEALHPALAWRRAGLMAVSGQADGPGLVAPVAIASAADGALAALRAIAPEADLPPSGALLLGERARLLGLRRQGSISPNGSCRLLRARDGMVALNLPRADDWALLPALFGDEGVTDWRTAAAAAAGQPGAALVAQGRLLGLAIAAEEAAPAPASPFIIQRHAPPVPPSARPLVLDFTSLWAGPLAGGLLAAAGARVIKIESRGRPDGARGGSAAFYDLLNQNKQSVAVDFRDRDEMAWLRRLVGRADIVLDAARPRALAALGIDAGAEAARGATWIAVTAHGRTGEAANWIGFGDDAAVAGGLSAAMARAWGTSLFAGDAIADPLTGITAALAAWAGWRAGGGRLVDIALSRVVAHAIALHAAENIRAWQKLAETDPAPLYPMRAAGRRARALGADNGALFAEFR